MQNWEFYEDELKEHSLAFALMNNKICWCSNITCSECAFGMNEGISCDETKLKWLYQEHQEYMRASDTQIAGMKRMQRGKRR